ncbi:MAG: WecB/TagA/CpsF family glycosyltransferase [Phycisphaerales bacterium]|nr:MAG: WecB/TagA/CpsF family glycosyltransferase [Phycisphaerales bacterium]
MRRTLKKLEILGIPLSPLASYDEAVDHVVERVRGGQKTFCVALTPEKSQRAHRDDELKQIIQSAEIQICDGVGVAIAARVLHGRKVARVTGVELFTKLLIRAEAEDLAVFLLGASPESNAGACEEIGQMCPRLRIVGSQHGYFEDAATVVEAINASGADMLFVAMGSPRQEKWIARHRDKLAVPFRMGVGGSFDVLSGAATRAPRLFRRTGTEFLYRFVKEPKRWRRELYALAFCARVFRAKVFG